MYYSVKRSVLRISAINAFNLTFYLLLVYACVCNLRHAKTSRPVNDLFFYYISVYSGFGI